MRRCGVIESISHIEPSLFLNLIVLNKSRHELDWQEHQKAVYSCERVANSQLVRREVAWNFTT